MRAPERSWTWPFDDGIVRERCGVLVHPEAVPILVADRPEDASRVVEKRSVVEHPNTSGFEIRPAFERIDEPAPVVSGQRRGHRVDREVPPEEVVFDRTRRDGRERARGLVRLRARGYDVDPLVLAVEDDGGAELVVRPHAPAECFRERCREGDRVAFDGDVDVEARLSEQDVPNRAADEVHPAVGAVDRGHCLEDRVQALGQGELAHPRPILPGLPAGTGAIPARLGHRRARFSPIRSQRVAGGPSPHPGGDMGYVAGLSLRGQP